MILLSLQDQPLFMRIKLKPQWMIPNIAILLPRGYRLDFTHIFAPAYDHPPHRANITPLPINLTQSDAQWYHQQTELFRTHHPNQENLLSVLPSVVTANMPP